MLRLTLRTGEYLMLGENVKLVFLGGTKNHLRLMIDAPKDVHIVRSGLIEETPSEYYAEPEVPEKFRRSKRAVQQ